MEKKTIYYIIGGFAVLGIGYYLWNKNKKDTQGRAEGSSEEDLETSTDTATRIAETKSKATEMPTSDSTPTSASTPTPTPTPVIKKLTPQELESKLQSACGKKPLSKKNKTLWNNCRNNMKDKLKSQGLLAFDGSYSFEGSNDFYSGFDDNFDLNL